ncbi:MAG: hypothetical protein IPP94_18255 [Ignavibacteria bacterium]|nr:hypothetical protein [Ignavibacteria bacterium]
MDSSLPRFFRAGSTLFGLSLVLLLSFASSSALAQTGNIALASLGCTCTHSGGGTGYPGYGPENYNDGITTTTWGWTSTAANPDPNSWIQFDWGAVAKSIGEVKFFNVDLSTRYMSSGRIQYWNGTSWINHYDFPAASILTRTITFSPVTTTKLRVTNMTITGSQTSNPNFYEIEIRSTVLGMNNAGISAMPSPLNFCTGTYPVIVTLVNSGGNRITSATINWTLNSVAQTPVTWTGLLDTLNATTRQTDVTLTTMNFPAGTPQNFQGVVIPAERRPRYGESQ